MYSLFYKPNIDRIFKNLAKKNPKQLEIIAKKLYDIVKDPHRFKNLRYPLNSWKRVHIYSHFVLTFSIDDDAKTVILEDYDHHNKIYKRNK